MTTDGPFVLPDEVALDYDEDGMIADITAEDCVDVELEQAAIDAWEAFHPGEPLPPKGSAAEFNAENPEFNAAIGIV